MTNAILKHGRDRGNDAQTRVVKGIGNIYLLPLVNISTVSINRCNTELPVSVTRRWDGIARRFVAVPDGLEQEPYCIVLLRIREKGATAKRKKN